MFKGPQGMSLAGNAPAAAVAATAAVAAKPHQEKMGRVQDGFEPSTTKIRNSHGEVPRTDRFMKIDINHPQCT